jgi:hypothetical protein
MNTVDTDSIVVAPDKDILKRRRLWYMLAIVLAVLTHWNAMEGNRQRKRK